MAKGSPEELRKAATQFEALLLMQLTSVLNNTGGEGEEDSLFGSDGGSGLAKQMFSEQLATTMAQSGGVGLSDVILRQTGGGQAKLHSGLKPLSGAMMAIKDIKANAGYDIKNNAQMGYILNVDSINSDSTFNNSSDPREAQVVARFQDEERARPVGDLADEKTYYAKITNTSPGSEGSVGALTNTSPIPSKGQGAETTDVTYQRPVAGRISSPFGNRFHPIDKKVKFHAGMDIAVPVGTPVGASADGVVSFAGWDGDYGNLVIVQHADGRMTRYGHLSKLIAAKDDVVTAGQTIALSGSTGKSTGPHVHFEVRENGNAVNPQNILSKVSPRTAER